MNRTVAADIAIIGAGPFGLSIAAHLCEHRADFCILGNPLKSWRNNMPKGMLLKSAGFASSLYDPHETFTLRQFCEDAGIPYRDLNLPVSLETFCSYGMAFQKRFVPDLQNENLVALNLCPEGFELHLEGGSSFRARRVVLGVGLDHFRNIPQELMHLPAELFSHSAEHHDLEKFRNQDIAVLGGGASAVDTAVLLHEAGAKVQQIVRRPALEFGGPREPASRSLLRRLRTPISGIGPGWKNRLCTDIPWLFRYLPDHLRISVAKYHLGPEGGWFMKDRAAPVPVLAGHKLEGAKVSQSRVQLQLKADGAVRTLSVDHVIAATGYATDVRRLPFLRPPILDRLQLIGQNPRLSANFESSIPGLYFVGSISAPIFGPVMRFAFGAKFTSRRVSDHLAARRASIGRNVAYAAHSP